MSDPFTGRDASPFGRRQRRPRGARIPVTVVTGFLGAGKTTLIRELLARPEGANTAVVVNEFGEVGIDHALLRSSSDTTVLLGNGCVCCAVRTDLQESLRTLFAERGRGAVPSFERVIIETSGLADPGPVLQTIASDRALGDVFHLQGLVAVVDAPGGAGNLDRAPEARHQVALADRIVLTKTDLADSAAATALTERLGSLSAAPVATAINGTIDPAFLLEESLDLSARVAGHEHEHAHAHSHGIDSFALFFERPLPWPVFEQAMAVLTGLRGADLLRVKGLVAVEGCRGPVVVHAVQHVAHRPVELEDWPDTDRRSRLVFITRNLAKAQIERLFAAIEAVADIELRARAGQGG
ncbi:MAG: GTP-binding protein [Alphaproteobacteria bacterium]|nr:MAG: GTP-binding protein [Alphaproteobacteria bacterium]